MNFPIKIRHFLLHTKCCFPSVLCHPGDPTAKKLTNQNHFSPRKVSISKPLIFNAQEDEAAKFTLSLSLAAAALAAPTMLMLFTVEGVFCFN